MLIERARDWVNRVRGHQSLRALTRRGLKLGDGVYVGDGVLFDYGWPWLISIGDDTVISAGTRILAHDASLNRLLGQTLVAPVSIGDGVYVGADAIVLPGVSIGDRAIVGAGSVVTRDVPPGIVVAGTPARPIRTTDEHIERARELMRSRPKYTAEWTVEGGISEQRKEAMLRDLSSGPGYVP